MKYADLSPAMKAQVDAKLGATTRKRDRAQSTGPGLPLTCARCGWTTDLPTDGRLSAHATEHPHAAVRYEWRPPPT